MRYHVVAYVTVDKTGKKLVDPNNFFPHPIEGCCWHSVVIQDCNRICKSTLRKLYETCINKGYPDAEILVFEDWKGKIPFRI